MTAATSWAAAGPRIEIDDAYIGGGRTGEGAGRGRRGHTPFIMAVETSTDGRPLYARLQLVRGFQTDETKRLCARVAAGTTVVTGSDRASARHPAFRWANTMLAKSRTASWRRTAPSRPNICRATSALSLGASTAGLS